MGVSLGKTVLCCAAAFAVVVTAEAWARGGSHGSGSHAGVRARSGGGSVSPHRHHHHHRSRGFVFFGSSAFFGAPFGYGGYPYGPPYYYGPDYTARGEPPKVYVERFDGQPTPQTKGEIFCPGAGAYYPAVTECQGGWQRVVRPEG
jgi:hypothetical protein